MSTTDLAGITKLACPPACNAERCVIGGKPICMHPCMSGVPKRFVNDEAIQHEYDKACLVLKVENIHKMKTE
jgi:hypothetical protein